MTKIRNSSRRRSYGKKGTHRQLTGRKQRAIESARIPEVKPVEPVKDTKPIENVTPTATKIPFPNCSCPPDKGDTGGYGTNYPSSINDASINPNYTGFDTHQNLSMTDNDSPKVIAFLEN